MTDWVLSGGKIVQEVLAAVVVGKYQLIRGGETVSMDGVDAS